MNEFKKPKFHKGDLELRFENDTICIYGNIKGLNKLAELCANLIKHPEQGHIHLEDCQLLSENSKKGAIAIFLE